MTRPDLTRRTFLGIVALFLIGGCGSGPRGVRVGKPQGKPGEPQYVPEAKAYLTDYPAEALSGAREVYDEATVANMERGLIALYEKCTHLGCKVPFCSTSGWFECPCHGVKYNRVGEKTMGPAPRGMDRYLVEVDQDGDVFIDTSKLLLGPPVGTNTTKQEPAGPFCV